MSVVARPACDSVEIDSGTNTFFIDRTGTLGHHYIQR